jgi:IS30 family transposase
MKKHNKITAPERAQIAWWLACRVTIREMARRLGRSHQAFLRSLNETSFQLVSQGEVKEVATRRNSTPRKVLSYQTPSGVFTDHIMNQSQNSALSYGADVGISFK